MLSVCTGSSLCRAGHSEIAERAHLSVLDLFDVSWISDALLETEPST
jgi:hypothetical protein